VTYYTGRKEIALDGNVFKAFIDTVLAKDSRITTCTWDDERSPRIAYDMIKQLCEDLDAQNVKFADVTMNLHFANGARLRFATRNPHTGAVVTVEKG